MWPFRKKPKITDIYLGLRRIVLAFEPLQAGLTATSPDAVWGLLMDTAYPEAVATLAVVADGTVSLYFSNGGGMIGAGQHESVWKAAESLLASAPDFLGHMQKTAELPLPNAGYTRISLLTFDGFFTAEAAEEALGEGTLPLSPLFHRAQDVITQLRLIEQANAADETGLTPLMAAAYGGNAAEVGRLLDAGAKLEAKDASGYTALMFACNAGRLDCVSLLLDRGADVHAKDNSRSTPIMFAAQNGHNDVLALLLAKGADPNEKGDHGLSAIGFAEQNRHAAAIALLSGSQ